VSSTYKNESICEGAIDGVEEVVPQHLKTNHACQTQSSEIPAKLKTAGDSLLTSGQACTSKNTCAKLMLGVAV